MDSALKPDPRDAVAVRDAAEAARLEALDRLEILDTPPEQTFDGIARLACALLDAPIGLVSLVDGDRVWFKARVGIEAAQIPRCDALCAHAIASGDVMVAPDAAQDARFCANPLVVGAPGVRFYAGAPMTTRDGRRLGTVCAIDRAPREGLDAARQARLADLAAVAVDMIETRRAGLEAHREAEARRVAEGAVAQALIRARDACQTRDRLLAHVSHELRTPLNGVTGMLSLLQRNARGDQTRRMLDIAMQSAEATISRVEELMTAAALSADTVRPQARPMRPSQLLASVATGHGPSARRKGLELLVDDRLGELEILADEDALRQVLACLLDNAVKFTAAGHVRVSGAVAGVAAGRVEVRFEVSDTGRGIPAAARAEIFDWFHMVDQGPSRRTGGCGLGLTIAREFVALMGGDIGVDSVERQGATFWFTVRAERLSGAADLTGAAGGGR